MRKGKCKLCLEEKILVKKSHILPEFMFKEFFDEKHKMIVTNISLENKKLIPTGFYDQYILCLNCETKVISQYESYASQYFYTTNKSKLQFDVNIISQEIVDVQVSNIDYRRFKLFLLSILWKASISKHYFFQSIKLGMYEEILRKMIINDDPGEEYDFMNFIVIARNKYLPLKMGVDPKRLKSSNGNTAYAFFISGIFYYFNISPQNVPDYFYKTCLKKNNTLNIAVVEGKLAEEFFDCFTNKKLRLKMPFEY